MALLKISSSYVPAFNSDCGILIVDYDGCMTTKGLNTSTDVQICFKKHKKRPPSTLLSGGLEYYEEESVVRITYFLILNPVIFIKSSVA
jgi:hypothetical protein